MLDPQKVIIQMRNAFTDFKEMRRAARTIGAVLSTSKEDAAALNELRGGTVALNLAGMTFAEGYRQAIFDILSGSAATAHGVTLMEFPDEENGMAKVENQLVADIAAKKVAASTPAPKQPTREELEAQLAAMSPVAKAETPKAEVKAKGK